MGKNKDKKQIGLFALTLPIFIELFLNMLMGNADTLMLSSYSDDAVASVGVATQIVNLMLVIFGFIAIGTSVVISQRIGAKSYKEASEVALVSLMLNLVIGIVMSLVVVIFGRNILELMNIEGHVLESATSYIHIVAGFMFSQAIIMTAGAVLRSYGHTKDAMYVTIGMNILHVIGNYLVIFGPLGFPVLGVEGVAWSTTISRIIAMFVILIIMVKKLVEPLPLNRMFKLPTQHLRELLRIGLPSAGEQLSYNLSQFVITYFITMISIDAITTRIYALNIMMFIFLFGVAIGQGTQILVGQYMGAREFDKAYAVALSSLKKAMIVAAIIASIFALFSDQLFSLFTDNEDIIKTGGILLLITIILEPGRAFNLVIIGCLRATGDTIPPLVAALFSMWGISVVFSYVLGIHFGLGLVGVFIAFVFDEWIRGLIMLKRWKSKKWLERWMVRN